MKYTVNITDYNKYIANKKILILCQNYIGLVSLYCLLQYLHNKKTGSVIAIWLHACSDD